MKKLLSYILYIWQLPQHVGALLFYAYIKKHSLGKFRRFVTKHGTRFYYNTGFYGAVTLGEYIFIGKDCGDIETTVRHEYGHHIQSLMLGPLYLFIIGIPSIIHAATYDGEDYYAFWTEKWANKLSENEKITL